MVLVSGYPFRSIVYNPDNLHQNGGGHLMRMIVVDKASLAYFIRRISEIVLDGKKKFIGEFKIYRIQRSIKQNKLYWLYLRCIHDETGHDEEDLHRYFKKKYLGWETKEIFGEDLNVISSSTNLNTKEFSIYLEQIRMQMLNDQSIDLPQPGDPNWEPFYVQYGLKK
jgi:hypothetical protein